MSLADAFRAALPEGRWVDDPEVLASVSRDAAPTVPAGTPLGLVRARGVDDVVAVLRTASAHGVPVVPRGAGSGLAGGANAVDGCVVLSLAAMDRVLELDPPTRTARVEPGVVTDDLARAAAAHGLWYPPDPASRAWSTVGGNVATNAGGGCCLKHGVTADWVAGLTAVLADGTVVRTGGRTRKDVVGYDLTRLLVGSEGTLAVVVEVLVRLRPPPGPASTLVASFGSLADAGPALVELVARTTPSLCELLDRTTVRAVDDATRMGLDRDAGALLLVQYDDADAPAQAAAAAALCAGAELHVTDDADEGQALLAARRAAYPSLQRLGTTLLDDVCVPVPQVPALVAAVEDVAARTGLVIGTFGHAGDGNLHPTVVVGAGQEEAAQDAFGALLDAALALGGTMSGEHGVGLLKAPYLSRQLGAAERALMHRVKAAFDPAGVLNPGKGL
ncbi:MAG TPA: FAD-linked oxidase C-terminal domain-containing protein [Mycobacteriales bacterium]|nr:FAD-linked oxidase C-terminal domain-containing protein [Mycobacteriales bacterium]